jgi:hypothetical protein
VCVCICHDTSTGNSITVHTRVSSRQFVGIPFEIQNCFSYTIYEKQHVHSLELALSLSNSVSRTLSWPIRSWRWKIIMMQVRILFLGIVFMTNQSYARGWPNNVFHDTHQQFFTDWTMTTGRMVAGP